MKRMSVVTKSFAPDFELCADLHQSMLDYSPDSVHHHIVVPERDLKLFGRLAGPRTHIRCETDLLPRWLFPYRSVTSPSIWASRSHRFVAGSCNR
jgi:hypothetical protein